MESEDSSLLSFDSIVQIHRNTTMFRPGLNLSYPFQESRHTLRGLRQ